MHINWFEVFAIILNFFILLALMNKFLFKPVMAAMDERERKIEEIIEKAEDKLSQANSLFTEYEEKIDSINEKEAEIITMASLKAEEKRDLLFKEFQEEIAQKRENFEKDFALEKNDFLRQFRSFLADYTLKISRKVLEPLSASNLEDKVFEGLLETIKNIPEDIIGAEKKMEGGQVDIISSAKMPEKEAQILSGLIRELLGKDSFNFTVNEDLLYGYQLIFNSFTINENLNFYLENMEEEVVKHQKLN